MSFGPLHKYLFLWDLWDRSEECPWELRSAYHKSRGEIDLGKRTFFSRLFDHSVYKGRGRTWGVGGLNEGGHEAYGMILAKPAHPLS